MSEPAPAYFRKAADRIRATALRLAKLHAPAEPEGGDCPEPLPPIEDPENATRDQVACNLSYYLDYIECFHGNCAPGDCKCRTACRTTYESYVYSVCYPPAS